MYINKRTPDSEFGGSHGGIPVMNNNNGMPKSFQ